MKQKLERNVLKMRPEKCREWQVKNNQVVILVPKYKSRFSRWTLKYMKSPNYKIKLDELGSFAWQAIDGFRSVEEIANLLKEEFGEKVEPVYNRLALLFQQMERNNLIRFKS
jgi:hypothetical protein